MKLKFTLTDKDSIVIRRGEMVLESQATDLDYDNWDTYIIADNPSIHDDQLIEHIRHELLRLNK